MEKGNGPAAMEVSPKVGDKSRHGKRVGVGLKMTNKRPTNWGIEIELHMEGLVFRLGTCLESGSTLDNITTYGVGQRWVGMREDRTSSHQNQGCSRLAEWQARALHQFLGKCGKG